MFFQTLCNFCTHWIRNTATETEYDLKESLQKTQSSFQSWDHGRMFVLRLKLGNERMNVNSTKTEVDESSAIQCQVHVDFIFDLKGIINKGFVISGQTLNHQLHFEMLKILCENLRKLRQKIWTSNFKLGGTDLKNKYNTVSYSFFFLDSGSSWLCSLAWIIIWSGNKDGHYGHNPHCRIPKCCQQLKSILSGEVNLAKKNIFCRTTVIWLYEIIAS